MNIYEWTWIVKLPPLESGSCVGEVFWLSFVITYQSPKKKESTKTKYLWSFSFQLHSARTAYGHRISNSTEPVANKFTPELSAAFYRTAPYVGEHFLNLQKGSPDHV